MILRYAPYVVVLITTAGLTGCAVVPASRVDTQREISSPVALGEGRKIAVLFSPDFSPQTSRSLGEKMVDCIRTAVRDDMPGVTVMSQEHFFAAAFPGLS